MRCRAFLCVQQKILKQICRPAKSPNHVKLPVKTIVQKAQICVSNLLEDALAFLSQVEVLEHDENLHTVKMALFLQNASRNDIVATVNLLSQEVDTESIAVNTLFTDLF